MIIECSHPVLFWRCFGFESMLFASGAAIADGDHPGEQRIMKFSADHRTVRRDRMINKFKLPVHCFKNLYDRSSGEIQLVVQ